MGRNTRFHFLLFMYHNKLYKIMIKSTKKVVIDSRTGAEEFIFVKAPNSTFNDEAPNEKKDGEETPELGKVSFLVETFTEKDNVFSPLHKIPAVYRKSTFLSKFGDLSMTDFELAKDENLISEICLNSGQYWGLGERTDWEILK